VCMASLLSHSCLFVLFVDNSFLCVSLRSPCLCGEAACTEQEGERNTMAETVRFGIIGCGGISQAHLRSIAAIEGAEAVAAADINEKTLNARADEYDVPRRYTDWRELLEDEAVQAVSICLPHSMHEGAAVEAAQHKKHILTEKPMCVSLAECDRM